MEMLLDALYLLNAVLASVAFAILVYRGRINWPLYDSNQKSMYFALTIYTLIAAYFSVLEYGNNEGMNPFTLIQLAFYLSPNILIIWAAVKFRRSAFEHE